MSNFCNDLILRLFPSRAILNKKQIDKIDNTLVGLYENISNKKKKLNQLKLDINQLSNKNNILDPSALPRDILIERTKTRIKTLLMHIKNIQNNINFFEQIKYNMENSHMTSEMANNIKNLKKQLIKSNKHLNIENIKDDVDNIADINDDIKDVNFVINETITNAWESDLECGDTLLKEFLDEEEEEEEEEEEKEKEKEKETVTPFCGEEKLVETIKVAEKIEEECGGGEVPILIHNYL